MAKLTMLDIAKLNGNDSVVGLIEENVKYAPEVSIFPFRTIRGTTFSTSVRTALPPTGFRGGNEGQAHGKSTFAKKIVETFIAGGLIVVDKAIAKAYEDGPDALKEIEANGIMQSALRTVGNQIFNGVSGDKGFPGLKELTPFGDTTLAGDALTVNAGGSTASTASSVYAVKFGPTDVTLVGGNGKEFDLGDWSDQLVTDSDGKSFMADVASLEVWIGLQVAHENCVRRIANLTADNLKGMTDALAAKLLSTFPVGHRPDAFFVSRRSLDQWQASRTVTLMGSAKVQPDQPNIAPAPTEYAGIPIIVTDSIGSTDAIES